jgi:hypothetical protein
MILRQSLQDLDRSLYPSDLDIVKHLRQSCGGEGKAKNGSKPIWTYSDPELELIETGVWSPPKTSAGRYLACVPEGLSPGLLSVCCIIPSEASMVLSNFS